MVYLLSQLISGRLGMSDAVIYILSSLVVIFLTLPVHEFAHGLAAVKLGDPTPRYQGRLTINPFRHIDYLGAACILLFGFGWAKPVGVNPSNFKNPKRDMAITALAGLHLFLCYVAYINVSLAVFNLIPIPPLDGSRLLSALLPNKQYYALMRYERYIFWGLLALLWLGVLDIPLDFLTGKVMSFITYIAGLPFAFIK